MVQPVIRPVFGLVAFVVGIGWEFIRVQALCPVEGAFLEIVDDYIEEVEFRVGEDVPCHDYGADFFHSHLVVVGMRKTSCEDVVNLVKPSSSPLVTQFPWQVDRSPKHCQLHRSTMVFGAMSKLQRVGNCVLKTITAQVRIVIFIPWKITSVCYIEQTL